MYYIQRLYWFFSFFFWWIYHHSSSILDLTFPLCVSIFFKLLTQWKPSSPAMREQYYTQHNIYTSPCYSLKSVSKPNEWEHLNLIFFTHLHFHFVKLIVVKKCSRTFDLKMTTNSDCNQRNYDLILKSLNDSDNICCFNKFKNFKIENIENQWIYNVSWTFLFDVPNFFIVSGANNFRDQIGGQGKGKSSCREGTNWWYWKL